MTPTADASRRVNEQIADALQKDIESGKLKAGEKLPAVRTIASDFGVAAAPPLRRSSCSPSAGRTPRLDARLLCEQPTGEAGNR